MEGAHGVAVVGVRVEGDGGGLVGARVVRDGALESTSGADGNMVGVGLGGNVNDLQKKKEDCVERVRAIL